ncbi:hypothetical protein [Dactylosporangium matsuzakiense]|uniref:HEAT repeat domain-containing protein n=1 Tax=Dactylosporangium matsuzakiense TaxID=53360 RepID=A0A9W6KW83_9ACTN|nr:hypothetical protein [Dactylosporangium matsuzakiense]GLL08362.1 hypothetical protein GCM10017581_101230 [Dactylosporangium matsuzakiense]
MAAAAELARLSPEYRRQAVQSLHTALDGAQALQAAATLAVISPADRTMAAARLLDAAHQKGPKGVRAATELVRHRHPGWEEAANLLRTVRDSDPCYVRRQAAQGLLLAGREFEREALERLKVMSGDPAASHHDRLEAALTLVRRADDANLAIRALQSLAHNTGAPPTVRRRAAFALPSRAPAKLSTAAAALRDLASDRVITAEVRAHSAADLARLGPGFLEEGISRLERQCDRAAARHLASLSGLSLDRALTMAGAARINRLPDND